MKKCLAILLVFAVWIGSCQKSPETISVAKGELDLCSVTLTEGEWLYGVSSTGTFHKNAAAKWKDSEIIPAGWDVVLVTR